MKMAMIPSNSNLTATAALIFPAIFFLYFFFLIKKWKNPKNKALKLPPGPPKLPIIGNLHQITSPPFRCFRDLSNHYGPIMYLKLGESAAAVVSSPEIAKEMLKDLDPIFAARKPGVAVRIMRYECSDIAFSPYGEYWKRMRKVCINQILSPKMVRSFRSIRGDEASRLVHSVKETSGRIVNLTERIVSLSSSITCRAAFGGVRPESGAMIELMAETLKMAGGFQMADYFPSSRIVNTLSVTKRRLRMMQRKLDAILEDIINEHRENLTAEENLKEQYSGNGKRSGNENLVDVLLRLKEGEEDLQFPFGNDNIKAVVFDIFSAGTETSSTTINWTMAELMRNPKVMNKVQAEVRQVLKGRSNMSSLGEDDIRMLKYLKMVIKEALRLHPPVPLLPRASREECQINGYTIPANTKVMVNTWAMHRDGRFWKDPETFKPERFDQNQNQNHNQNQKATVDFVGGDFEYLPFGSGRRMCPGMTFGLATVELVLAQLLYNFDWKLPEGVRAEDLDMTENLGLTASRKQILFVVATPYDPKEIF